ncbi:Lambda-carrageenase precursor [Novipirellula galeiformis]|uniref:Lambda-carrageenase n=2 Tax=Novipirellula galeiformis TaxID=2528004 RepID=A0A5C6CKD6_9BACT|nr:Lambda-carrageenase precursor [Novipirellula galeiformis]
MRMAKRLSCLLMMIACLLNARLPQAFAQHEKVLSLNSLDGIKHSIGGSTASKLKVISNGSDGDGAVELSAVSSVKSSNASGSQYFGIMVSLGKTWDLTNKQIAVDARSTQPANTLAFYVRAYNKGETKPSLSFASWSGELTTDWKTFRFQEDGPDSSLRAEPAVVADRRPTHVDRIEFIIGTRTEHVPLDLQISNLHTLPPVLGLDDVTEPKKLLRTIPVVHSNDFATVLYPDSAVGKSAATQIVKAVREKTGVSLKMRPGTTADREFTENVILLGNVFDNPAMLLLYSRQFTPVDSVCPGPTGYLLQTVHDPFGNGHGAIVVGASDDAGLKLATDAFVQKINERPFTEKELSFPKFLDAKYGEAFLRRYSWLKKKKNPNTVADGLKRGQEILDTGKHTSIAGLLRTTALRYQLSGNSDEAKLYVALWDLYAKSAVNDPSQMGGGMWGFDSDFPSYEVVSGWDNMEEDLALTDTERLQVARNMARWLREAVVVKATMTPRRVAFNHQTFPTLGVLRAGLYFSQAYPDAVEGGKWLAQADRVFGNQQKYFKCYEDCNTYQWLTDGHVMRYALARPDFTVFENGNAERMSDYCIATMNNLGYQVPYGDTGAWTGSTSEQTVLNAVTYATGNQAALWASTLKQNNRNVFQLYNFQRAAPVHAPSGFDGVKMWPLEPAYVNTFPVEPRPADNQLFDKVSFRDSFDVNSPYLLLDGLNNGGHGHLDGNSVEQLTQFDRIWLADNDYFKSQVKYQNSIQILRDGQASEIPAYAALRGYGDAENYGYSHTQLADYSDADWDRYVIWLKDKQAFMVLDKVTAQESGEFQCRLWWHGIGAAKLTEDGMLLTQNGPSMWVQVAKGPKLQLSNDAELGSRNWARYKHADPVVRSMNATARVRLEKGQHYLFATVFQGNPDSEANPWEMDFLKGYKGVQLNTGDQTLQVQLKDNSVELLNTPGKTIFAETQTNEPSKSTFEANASGEKVALVPPIANLESEYKAAAFQTAWSLNPAPFTCTKVVTAQFQTNASKVLLASTAEGNLLAVSPQGEVLWSKTFPTQLNDVAAGDVDGDGIDEIAIARQDGKTTLLDASGKELWSQQLSFYRVQPYVNLVRMGDLDGDGKDEVVIGSQNWRFYVYNGAGKELWQYETVHPSRSGTIADLDGDGKKEVLAGTHYYTAWALSHDGKRLWGRRFSAPICYDITTGNFEGNKTRGVIFGGGDGTLYHTDFKGKVRMQYDTGDEVRHVVTADLDGDGVDEILATSDNGYLYCFGADGKLRWLRQLGDAATAIVTMPVQSEMTVVAGTRKGNIYAFDAKGNLLRQQQESSKITQMTADGSTLKVATEDGRLLSLTP